MRRLDPKLWAAFVRRPIFVAALTTSAILSGLLLRPDLRTDGRLLWVVGFALLAAMATSACRPAWRWTLAAYLIAAGLGLVAGLHPPHSDVAARAAFTRQYGVP